MLCITNWYGCLYISSCKIKNCFLLLTGHIAAYRPRWKPCPLPVEVPLANVDSFQISLPYNMCQVSSIWSFVHLPLFKVLEGGILYFFVVIENRLCNLRQYGSKISHKMWEIHIWNRLPGFSQGQGHLHQAVMSLNLKSPSPAVILPSLNEPSDYQIWEIPT